MPTGTIDLDTTSALEFAFDVDGPGARVEFSLRNTRTGNAVTWIRELSGGRFPVGFVWDGTFSIPDPDGVYTTHAATTGTYAWTVTASPLSGDGPGLRTSGTFATTRTPRDHDLDADGVFDLLAVTGEGRLTAEGSYRGNAGYSDFWGARGWDAFDRLEVAGDVAGTPHSDLVARDRGGVLWLYRSNGGRTHEYLEPRSRVGGGWQVYRHLAGGSDLTADGRPDLVAADASGVLWLYEATGRTTAPFAPRERIGGGWQAYNQITAVGNVAGGPGGDLVARDKNGVLWLYLGKGDGTFTARERLGGGFQRYSELVGGGDWDGDGRNDLLAVEPATDTVFAFEGTGRRDEPLDLTRKATLLFKGVEHDIYA
ncbi:FG-GAP-like repeat-containing protein [Streptomyces sp. NPDC014773]|uniref:FG-GAP-like repeat-containing protein n=1 Tax=Streptomyces sp. NPDC014773 TaxID=3364908 RepID=UPI0036FC1BB5